MRVLFAMFVSSAILCSTPAFSQDAATATAACGPKEDRLNVNPENTREALTQAESGKALLYIVEDYGFHNRILGGGITYRVGVDGAWAGAINRHNPYLSISLTQGEHHFCVNWQSRLEFLSKAVSLAHLDAQADKIYYFRIREWESKTEAYVDLDPIDSDQGKFLVASAHPKK